MKKLLLLLMLMVAFCCNNSKAAEQTDEITIDGLGVTANSYADGTFSDKQFTSKAVYAGKCIKSGSNIQLNGTKSIFVTTASGGKIVKIEVFWGKSGKNVVLYKKDTAYGADESQTNGTGFATLKYDASSSSASYTPTSEDGDIKYIGIGSTGAVYISKIVITWDDGTGTSGGGDEPTPVPALPVVTFEQDGKTVTAVNGGSYAVDLNTTINVTSENATSIMVLGGENTMLDLTGSTASFSLTEFGEYMFQGSNGTKSGDELTISFTEKQTDPIKPVTGDTYKLVTSTADLVAGENYVLASTYGGKTYAMSTAAISSGGLHPTEVTLAGDVLTAGSEVLVFKLSGESGAWLWNFTNYKGTGNGLAGKGSETAITVSSPVSTTVFFTSDGYAEIVFKGADKRMILYNGTVFKNYASSHETDSGYHQIRIYKQVKEEPKTYTLPEQSGNIFVGETYQISLGDEHPATINYSVPEGCPYASVSSDGLVTGLEAGSVAVAVSWPDDASWNAGSGLVNVTVKAPLADPALSFLHDVIRGKLGVGVAAQSAYHDGTGVVTYTSGNPAVVSVDEHTGMIAPANVHAVGEAVITASAAATDTHKAATASYRVIIEEPDQGSHAPAGDYTYDFVNQNYGLYDFSSTLYSSDYVHYEHNVNQKEGCTDHVTVSSITVAPVTLTIGGHYRRWVTNDGKADLRLYYVEGKEDGTLTFSVPDGYSIEKITFNSGDTYKLKLDDYFTADVGTIGENSNIWDADGATVTSVKLTRVSAGQVEIKTIDVTLAKTSTVDKTPANLTFAQKVYNTYAGEPTVVNAASNADNSIPADNIAYTIDNLDAADYSVNRDDEAAGNLTVTVARTGVYTLRAVSAATGERLAGFAILRLNVFPRIDVTVGEDCVRHEADVVVLPENGGKVNFSDVPSTVSVFISRSDDGGNFGLHDGSDLILDADTEISYKMEYAGTADYATGQNDLHVYLVPKKPECVKTENRHIISVEQDNVKILYRSMIYTVPGGARVRSLAERAAGEGAWTEVNAMSHSIEIPALQSDQLFIVDAKTVKTTDYAGNLESDVVTTGYDNDGNLSGISEVSVDAAKVEFFNLQGVRVDGELAPGVYIRRQGSKASKVIIH